MTDRRGPTLGPNLGPNHGPIGEDDLQAYIDDRLPAAAKAKVEAWLAAHPEAAAAVAADLRHRDALRDHLHAKYAEPIPARLRIASIRAGRRAAFAGMLRVAAAACVLVAVGGVGGWLAHGALTPPAARQVADTTIIAHDAVAAFRTFTVEVVHPVEVPASNEAHLVAWLSKWLGRPLLAPDLNAFGFRLVGGRLLPAGSAAAAQLMYEAGDGKRLTLYVRAGSGAQTAFRFAQEGTTATFSWIEEGFGFAVSAQAGRDELLPIAEAVYRAYDAPPPSTGRSG